MKDKTEKTEPKALENKTHQALSQVAEKLLASCGVGYLEAEIGETRQYMQASDEPYSIQYRRVADNELDTSRPGQTLRLVFLYGGNIMISDFKMIFGVIIIAGCIAICVIWFIDWYKIIKGD